MDNQIDKKSLLSRWKEHPRKDIRVPHISKAPVDIDIPLSRGQQRLWILQQLYPSNPFYNYCELYELGGGLNTLYLSQSIQAVFSNNSIFRTTFYVKDGTTYQKVHDDEVKIALVDLSHLEGTEKKLSKERLIESVTKSSFDLSVFPLVSSTLIKLSQVEHILILNMHHIITDKWSMGVFREELAMHYQNLIAGKSIEVVKKLQYSDYAYWESNQSIDENQLKFWQDRLKGEIPILDLPLDYPRKMSSSFKGGLLSDDLSEELSNAILALAKNLNTTPFVLLLSVFKLLLFKYTGQQDILVGSPISNRNERSVEKLIGFFNETVVLRSNLSPKMTFRELVDMVKQNTMEAFLNKDVPFDLLVQKLKPTRSLSLNPFFQVMFLFHAVPQAPTLDNECTMEYAVLDLGIAKFDLTLYVAEENGKVSTTFEYATDLFRESTIARMQQQYQLLLESVIKDISLPLPEYSVLTDREKQLFLKVEPDTDYNIKGIHELITKQASENPSAIAVVYESESISYGQLDHMSTILAKNLQKYTKGHNQFVGLCVDRSIDMIIGLIGILKAGCAYLPLDPEYPKERIDYMLEDAKIKVLLTNDKLLSNFDKELLQALMISSLYGVIEDEKITLPEAKGSNYAYLIYTSGSSGTPKGVPITHKNIISSTLSRTKYYSNVPSSFLLVSSIAFDSSKVGIFWTLCTGGQLVLTRKGLEQDINLLNRALREYKISHTLMLPSLYKIVLENMGDYKFPDLKTVIVAGEVCGRTVCNLHLSLLPNVELHNEYGPTEATVWCSAYKIMANDEHVKVPIGKPIANSKMFLLDDNLSLVPFGAQGEIYIGGPGVATGYLNREELSEQVFIVDPFQKNTDYKLYKTGDIGRYRFDGNLEFIGRKDHQVKIRGHRVELHEIENLLRSTGMVHEVLVDIEATEEELHNNGLATTSAEKLILLMSKYFSDAEINDIIMSVTSLRKEDLKHLLVKMQE
ncbi:amino acid adenylation domain-containing protein [Arenibacter sp. F26102]|uniref:non-ribosomal peptide synthetase n=1 Tax=Arenibacter sp. F26102 TaxID=2926416 RepID=UPI001FF48DBD|nr:amino acid adenylation domain-containing protein [Arenibacter sp. F26102]